MNRRGFFGWLGGAAATVVAAPALLKAAEAVPPESLVPIATPGGVVRVPLSPTACIKCGKECADPVPVPGPTTRVWFDDSMGEDITYVNGRYIPAERAWPYHSTGYTSPYTYGSTAVTYTYAIASTSSTSPVTTGDTVHWNATGRVSPAITNLSTPAPSVVDERTYIERDGKRVCLECAFT
jgi:hypothetical protein